MKQIGNEKDDSIGMYILEGKKAVRCYDVKEWGKSLKDRTKCTVAQDTIGKTIFLSTVFLGLDHSFGHGEPLLFETCLFKNRTDSALSDSAILIRTSTWEEAEKHHKDAINQLKEYMHFKNIEDLEDMTKHVKAKPLFIGG